MGIWRNVTDTFSEERRHYSNTYLELCADRWSYSSKQKMKLRGELISRWTGS